MSLHSDKGWLFIAFSIGGRRMPPLYLHLRAKDTREKMRAGKLIIKEVETLIAARDWVELARRFPNNKGLAQFRPAFTPDATTFRQAAARFLEYQANANKPATVMFYRTIIETHITGSLAGEGPSRASNSSQLAGGPSLAFADKPIRLIGASDIAALYAPVAQRGHQAQAQNIRRVVSAVFQWARGERGSDGDYLVADNPVGRTRPIDRSEDPHGIEPFTSEEITTIIAGSRPGWERRLVTVAFETGLRPAELFGLKRKDIEFGEFRNNVVAPSGVGDLARTRKLGQTSHDASTRDSGDGAFIHIRQTYSRFGEGSVKNRGSRRSVPLSDAAVRALREQLAEVELRSVWLWPNDRINLRGDAASSKNQGRVSAAAIPSASASPRNPQLFSAKNWPAILKRAGVEHRSFYQCRHTYAMRSLAAGVAMPEIAKRMGHKNLQMLIDHYLKWPVEREKPERMKR